MASTFARLPRARWVVTTLGARGSVLLERPQHAQQAHQAQRAALLGDIMAELHARAEAEAAAGPEPELGCTTGDGVEVRRAPRRGMRLAG